MYISEAVTPLAKIAEAAASSHFTQKARKNSHGRRGKQQKLAFNKSLSPQALAGLYYL